MPVKFGRLIKETREVLDLTQEQLARSLKVAVPTVSRWETGKTNPDTLAVHAIESFLRKRGPRCAALVQRYFGKTSEARPSRRRRAPQRMATDAGEAPTAADTIVAPAQAATQPLDTKSMETMLWRAACAIRGEKDAPKFKDYILPLVFIKRLSDVFDDEIARLAADYGDEDAARIVVEADHTVVAFYIPPEAGWAVVSGRRTFDWLPGRRPKTLGEQLTTTVRVIAAANPSLKGVVDIVDYNETRNGEREISDEALSRLIETLSDPRYRLGLRDVEADFLGRAYEYLLRKFAEGQGQSAGEFFTPKEVGWLIAHLVRPSAGAEVYDPCCGSGGLLVKCELARREREPAVRRHLKLFGQELTGASFAIARMNVVLHGLEAEIARGNTMTNPKFLTEGRLKQFDIVVTNPMWNQDNFDPAEYERDPFERFDKRGGFAPASSADWAWLQHVLASLDEQGRAAVVLDTGAASRGSGGQGENREKTIRRWFVEQDVVEGVVLLPDNLFYNTTAAGLIVVLNRAKPAERRGKVVLVNASAEFHKGRPKNFVPDTAVRKIADAFHAGVDVDGFVRVAGVDEIAKNDFSLSPSRYVQPAAAVEQHDIQAVLDELERLHGQAKALDVELKDIFGQLGYRYEGGTV
ncbi:MAG: N-6 DNA methylase [Candidatus Rokubacteria bacterium]|nr:N-6 DNA methylase [Candidatus Rokubacteria bacterium]